MKLERLLILHDPQCGARPPARAARAKRAFTMVEVAISLAIIGFALVAIIGILPAGLNVQRENREETIINQEVSIWMDAIRSGAEGMDYLTNYVDGIEFTTMEYDDVWNVVNGPFTIRFTPSWSEDPTGYLLDNGAHIIGLLSTPKYRLLDSGNILSNHVVAYVRAISGAATDTAPQDNASVKETAFSYQLTSDVVPYFASQANNFDYVEFLLNSAGDEAPAMYSRSLANNVHEVRLLFQWPLRPPYNFNDSPPLFPTKVGKGRQAFRTMIGGAITNEVAEFFFTQPGQFRKPKNP